MKHSELLNHQRRLPLQHKLPLSVYRLELSITPAHQQNNQIRASSPGGNQGVENLLRSRYWFVELVQCGYGSHQRSRLQVQPSFAAKVSRLKRRACLATKQHRVLGRIWCVTHRLVLDTFNTDSECRQCVRQYIEYWLQIFVRQQHVIDTCRALLYLRSAMLLASDNNWIVAE